MFLRQHVAAHFLSVCGGERGFICSHVLRERHQRFKETVQTVKEDGSVLATALEILELIVQTGMFHKVLNILYNTACTVCVCVCVCVCTCVRV